MSDITKLPKWAQKHIQDLELKADNSRRALDDFLDTATPSAVYIDEILCDTQPPRPVRRYIQGHKVAVEAGGVTVEVYANNGTNGRHGVRVSFMESRGRTGQAVIMPVASNVIEIRAVKEFALDSEHQ